MDVILLVPTQQGVGTLAPNDLTPCRMAFYFVSTFAKATFPGFSANEKPISHFYRDSPL
jgi:hypothetical protein